jgi:predicted MFS family arabinose efflux permease
MSIAAVFAVPCERAFGEHWSLLGTYVCSLLSLLLLCYSTAYGLIVFALLTLAFVRMLFHPLLQAYVTRRIAPSFVGTAVGGMEAAWPLSTLVGAPIMAWLYDALGWRGPFIGLAVVAGVFGFGVPWSLRALDRRRYAAVAAVAAAAAPTDDERIGRDGSSSLTGRAPPPELSCVTPDGDAAGAVLVAAGPRARAASFVTDTAVLGCMCCVFLKFLAYDALGLAVSKWCVDSYGFSVGDMGTVSLVLGLAEITGTMHVLLLSERLGFQKFSALTSIVGTCGGVAIACVKPDVPFAVAGALVWLTWSTFEAGVVIVMGAASDVRPDMQTTSTATMFVVMGVGRGVGDVIGAAAWGTGSGPLVVGAVIILCNVLGGSGFYCGDRCRRAKRRLLLGVAAAPPPASSTTQLA